MYQQFFQNQNKFYAIYNYMLNVDGTVWQGNYSNFLQSNRYLYTS